MTFILTKWQIRS